MVSGLAVLFCKDSFIISFLGLTHSEVCFELLKSWMISASRAYIGGCEETRLLKAGPSEMLGLLDILNEEEVILKLV